MMAWACRGEKRADEVSGGSTRQHEEADEEPETLSLVSQGRRGRSGVWRSLLRGELTLRKKLEK